MVLWFFVLIEPQWLLAEYGINVALKMPVLLFVGTGAMLALGVPTVGEWMRRWTWYAPYAFFVAVALVGVPLALNPGHAWEVTRFYVLMWVLIVATVTLVDTPRRAELFIIAYGLHFILWGLWGDLSGAVWWHTTLANFDGFGSFMVVGAGMCAFLVAASSGRLRTAFIVAVPLCVVGVVASFARGAALGLVAVFGLVWWRAPRKGAVLGAAILSAGIMIAAETALHGGEYWSELATIAQGTEESTGEDRWIMWNAAFRVFLENPVIGAGSGNWGIYAADIFEPGDLGGRYELNPARLYGRQTHNSYVQILAEQGILGAIALVWILTDFWRRNARMRTPAARERWAAMGGRLRLLHVSFALEAAMVGWMCAAFFYSQAGKHWFYTILALNLLVSGLLEAGPGARARHVRPPRHRFAVQRAR